MPATVGSDPIAWFHTWPLNELSDAAKSNLKSRLCELNAEFHRGATDANKQSLRRSFQFIGRPYSNICEALNGEDLLTFPRLDSKELLPIVADISASSKWWPGKTLEHLPRFTDSQQKRYVQFGHSRLLRQRCPGSFRGHRCSGECRLETSA